jgi:hypothetical protein
LFPYTAVLLPKRYGLERNDRIALLAELGDYLLQAPDAELSAILDKAYLDNRWFTRENTLQALSAIAKAFLNRDRLLHWVSGYTLAGPLHPGKTIGLVMAGNIPLVGFQDWLCVFVAGHRALVKCSEKDKVLLPFLVGKIGEWAFESWEYTEFLSESDKLVGFDAVIATGSNNTARYFEQYFRKYTHIIRRNRNSVAVLDGCETPAELLALGRDIFSYFGLGCRNVSKLYVPRQYDFSLLLEILHEYRALIQHDKYKNNFDYNLTLFVLNRIRYLNTGSLLLKEDAALQSRIASIHYEYYDDQRGLLAELDRRNAEIQCVVGHMVLENWTVLPFGKSQEPGLADYPDGVDIMKFLSQLEH